MHSAFCLLHLLSSHSCVSPAPPTSTLLTTTGASPVMALDSIAGTITRPTPADNDRPANASACGTSPCTTYAVVWGSSAGVKIAAAHPHRHAR